MAFSMVPCNRTALTVPDRPVPLHQDSLLASQLYHCGQVRLFYVPFRPGPDTSWNVPRRFRTSDKIFDDVLSGNDTNELF